MSARILVADDSVTIQKVVELTFSKEDFVLTQARNGEEAIQKARETRPDLVLLDLVMPDMNGYDVCAALRTEPVLRTVPIILLAGTFESYDPQRGTQAGANDFITKPFESQVLIGKVKQLLFARSLEAGSASAPAKPAPGSVTVKISPAVAAARAGLAAPEAARPTPPPPPPPPQEELWQLLGDSSLPTPAISEVPTSADGARQESTAVSDQPREPEGQAFDVSALDLEPLPAEMASAADAMEVLPLPESLSLDDLLAAGAGSTDTSVAGEAVQEMTATPEPVFELPDTEAPPLPMEEVGKEETPLLPVEELLRPAASEEVAADTLTLLPELDLAGIPDAVAPTGATPEPAHTALPQLQESPFELPLQEMEEARVEAVSADTRGSAAGIERLPPVQTAEDSRGLRDALTRDNTDAEVAAVVPPAPMENIILDRPSDTPPADFQADDAVQTSQAAVSPTEMVAMREAVTERVAQDLKRELSEKLLERFEKIVWEVVPDLAEILITKEIERIRRLAEEEKNA